MFHIRNACRVIGTRAFSSTSRHLPTLIRNNRKNLTSLSQNILKKQSYTMVESLFKTHTPRKPVGTKVFNLSKCPENADEFLNNLKSPSENSTLEEKLEYQHILISLLAKKYPEALCIISSNSTISRIESHPPEVVFKHGSQFDNSGTHDIIEHVKGNQHSQLMGSSFYPQFSRIEGDYIYHITPVENTGLNISSILEMYNLTHSSSQKIPWIEAEIAIGRYQPPNQYQSCQRILERHEDNRIRKLGPKIENPNWENKINKSLDTDINSLWKKASSLGFIK